MSKPSDLLLESDARLGLLLSRSQLQLFVLANVVDADAGAEVAEDVVLGRVDDGGARLELGLGRVELGLALEKGEGVRSSQLGLDEAKERKGRTAVRMSVDFLSSSRACLSSSFMPVSLSL